MRWSVLVGCAAAFCSFSALAQTSCPPHAVENRAAAVVSLQRHLMRQAVLPDDPHVAAPIAAELGALKDRLTELTQTMFQCSAAATTPEHLQTLLANAVHADEGTGESRKFPAAESGKEQALYGADLGVQVLPLFDTPHLLEVDFRYSIPCGDDHLLLVYEAGSANSPSVWHQRLRWDTASYRTVEDAFGDFVLLTPLTGSYSHPTWRFMVAHGHPGCGDQPRPSHFTMDLLTPASAGAVPTVSWHFDHPYTQGSVVPRLATTEDTVDFRFVPAGDGQALPTGSASTEVYRFHLNAQGTLDPVEPAPAAATSAPAGTVSPKTSPNPPHSPQ